MRIANIDGRVALVRGDEYLDIARASGGQFVDDAHVFENWSAFLTWSRPASAIGWRNLDPGIVFGAPVTRPRQVIGVGLNYRQHREEVAAAEGYGRVDVPLVFAKLAGSICGPTDDVALSSDRCDYEAELVIVMGRIADRVDERGAWDCVAGLTGGQDISDRKLQYMKPNQVMMAKSLRTFSPIGPVVVTPDEFERMDEIEFSCSVNGEERQRASTSSMILNVPGLVSWLSRFTVLLPGDLIFSGTPSGVGHRLEPQRFLSVGDAISTAFAGIGEMRNGCVVGLEPLLG